MDDDLTDTVIRPRVTPPSSAARGPADLVDDTVLRAAAPPRAVGRHEPAEGVPSATDAVTRHPYRFRINGEAPLSTATPTVIGRAPRGPRLPEPQAPRLLRVESPLHEVSASHIEVRQQGASVVVTDLRSTNGTVVIAPGTDPVRLRPGESHVVVPGSQIDIGDGNVIEILSTDRVTPRGSNPPGEVIA